MYVLFCSMEVPVMWVRPDPEMQWIRQISMQQADTVWMNTLTYNRDAVSQLEVFYCENKYLV